ncbi:AbiH family protein [Apibacter raozihei]|uniref:AbiH family protein n=1 Tax=Apibacter raozihei TaxID=2500547 RepID=UPI000FE30254|nr:AbiH family protein [Apibacter raozihei]
MNRIILIGNGFDLAHGMKTSYGNFMDWFWNIKLSGIVYEGPNSQYEDEDIKITQIPLNWNPNSKFDNAISTLSTNFPSLEYKNRFLKHITEKQYIQNWVDIENEYYKLLKDIMSEKEKYYSISELNSDFEKIKNELENYLNEVQEKFDINQNLELIRSIEQKIYSDFKLNDFIEKIVSENIKNETNKIQHFISEFGRRNESLADIIIRMFNLPQISTLLLKDINNIESAIRILLKFEETNKPFNLMIEDENILFLNFNYIHTEGLYAENPNQIIHIHGSLDTSSNNPIIFGFGDELDEEYKKIETLNNNEYLENIKSIKYLETDNYKRLLEFVNSDEYQIFIFGHSCGNSDRTLLNTLFEHENCISIKPFYHLKENGTDNYSDIVRNISRNFNNKAIMRDKVVNKTFCEPLA